MRACTQGLAACVLVIGSSSRKNTAALLAASVTATGGHGHGMIAAPLHEEAGQGRRHSRPGCIIRSCLPPCSCRLWQDLRLPPISALVLLSRGACCPLWYATAHMCRCSAPARAEVTIHKSSQLASNSCGALPRALAAHLEVPVWQLGPTCCTSSIHARI